ncbi:translation elongation factor Ts [Anaplasma phagocytophilum str. CRT53-1]|uniref:Elongation factor Ts n=1 Tax=Anaplasma phagocytophilum str. CRT53-1 TaxID=1359157 RepID=A0A0F3Q376_ANAPH|nr:translation elongation factor Ts [Anaplasma phagocytophilum]KJV86687.1 translation elongation factor Ts [Anaplasma phagocytophilum str. CRT53-1]
MKIDVEVIKELRQITGAGIGDCKEALESCSGDMDKAREYLREKGLSKAYKKSHRDVADGLVAVFAEGDAGAILKLGSETDFVARNEKFRSLALGLVRGLHGYGAEDLEGFSASSYDGSRVADEIVAAAAVLGENVVLSGVGFVKLSGPGVIGSYVHGMVSEGLGKAAALVVLEGGPHSDELASFAKQLAMHIVAAKPEALSIDTLSSDVVGRERELVARQVEALGKPDSVAQKIIEGRMQKFFEEMVLLEQVFVMDGQTKIRDLLVQKGQSLKHEIRIAAYRLFAIA